MAQTSEAAGLLQTGALYTLRAGFVAPEGADVFLGVKPGSFSVYFGDEPIYHFDLDGRWQRAFVDGVHFLKGLDATVQALDRLREGGALVLRRRALGYAEAVDLDARVRADVLDLGERMGGSLRAVAPPPGVGLLEEDSARELIDRVAAWDATAWFSHRERYLGTYGPISFLPPETSNPVIVQATLGHARGPGFGGERPSPYYERSPAEFAEHARAVARLLGRRALQCRQASLAGADALRRPPESILADLDLATEVFPMSSGGPRPRARDVDVLGAPASLDGFHAFLHEFDRPPFTREVWDELRSRRFDRLVVGIESGSARVRRLYGRDWPDEGLREWVGSCPVGLGVVVLVGSGGAEGGDGHVEATAALVESLPLRPGTLVSLVDSDELDTRDPEARGFGPLDPAARIDQRARMKDRLTRALSPGKVKVTTYSTGKRWL